MTLPDLFAPGWTAVLVNHLWQSTAVALLAWLLTIALRDNEARIRYAIWMIASIKFLVPFSLLARIGEHWAKPAFPKPERPQCIPSSKSSACHSGSFRLRVTAERQRIQCTRIYLQLHAH